MSRLYQIGDQVIYGIHGVCIISSIVTRVVDRKQIEYYVLEPKDQSGAQFYVPTQNRTAVAKLRPVISAQELHILLNENINGQVAWISDENLRKQYYRDLITSGDRAALISMVHALHIHKENVLAKGKKLHLCDENFLRDAEKLLGSEFSLVLDIEPSQVGDYIKGMIQQ